MDLVEYAKCFIGRPYIWAGNGSGKNAGGFDCSGLVVECLQAVGVLANGSDYSAKTLYKHLLDHGWVKVPCPGCPRCPGRDTPPCSAAAPAAGSPPAAPAPPPRAPGPGAAAPGLKRLRPPLGWSGCGPYPHGLTFLPLYACPSIVLPPGRYNLPPENRAV